MTDKKSISTWCNLPGVSVILPKATKRGTEFDDKFIILGPDKETEEAIALAIKEKVLMTAKIRGD
jgi:hypothetical protein|tara:strand:- start:1872 stop:2066 length:195 start_codon:yes stop_codon:yes gene_type:complete